mmetsp:Transcript_15083/g.44008  ORF Transcript_15083/g.44008 Transcript_15083/m.44008 type:complete len:247 (-) Transcript_15083:451-1191(-)
MPFSVAERPSAARVTPPGGVAVRPRGSTAHLEVRDGEAQLRNSSMSKGCGGWAVSSWRPELQAWLLGPDSGRGDRRCGAAAPGAASGPGRLCTESCRREAQLGVPKGEHTSMNSKLPRRTRMSSRSSAPAARPLCRGPPRASVSCSAVLLTAGEAAHSAGLAGEGAGAELGRLGLRAAPATASGHRAATDVSVIVRSDNVETLVPASVEDPPNEEAAKEWKSKVSSSPTSLELLRERLVLDAGRTG